MSASSHNGGALGCDNMGGLVASPIALSGFSSAVKALPRKLDFLLAQANHAINIEHDKKTTQRFNEWEKLIFYSLDIT